MIMPLINGKIEKVMKIKDARWNYDSRNVHEDEINKMILEALLITHVHTSHR